MLIRPRDLGKRRARCDALHAFVAIVDAGTQNARERGVMGSPAAR